MLLKFIFHISCEQAYLSKRHHRYDLATGIPTEKKVGQHDRKEKRRRRVMDADDYLGGAKPLHKHAACPVATHSESGMCMTHDECAC